MQTWWAEETSLKTLKILLFKNIWLVVYTSNNDVYLSPNVENVLLCCSNMKSLTWAGSAKPDSMFLGAAICWDLNGFAGPNCNEMRDLI